MMTGREIRLIEKDDDQRSARDVETDVASQGETRQEALENLDQVIKSTVEAREEISDTPETDALWEAIVLGVFLAHRLVAVTVRDRSYPAAP